MLTAVALILACSATTSARVVEDGPVSLRTSLDPLIKHFNAGKGKPRFVALLSSTCPACVFGAKAVKQSVLEAYPKADLQVSIVWIDMLSTDNDKAAAKSSAIFDDKRVKQFHDPKQTTGRVIGKELLYQGAGPAWDIYLFYDADAVWTETPPEPVEWYHQLGGGKRADPARFRPGKKLVDALKEATARVLAVEAPVRADASPSAKATATFDGVVLQVQGMSCQGCADAVQRALGSVPGVAEAKVEFASGLGWIRLDKSKPADVDALIDAVEKAGFKAGKPEASQVIEIPADLLEPTVFRCTPADLDLQVLGLPGCPNTAALCANLAEACKRLSLACRIQRVDLTELPADDPRRGWGSPTALVGGADLMGEPRAPALGLCCRIYRGGTVPEVGELTERIRRCCVIPPTEGP